MSADIDVLVTRSSPISFSSSYLPYQPDRTNYNELNSSQSNTFKYPTSDPHNIPNNTPLDFASALGSSPVRSSSPITTSFLSHSPPKFSSTPPTHFTFHGRCSSPTLRPISSSNKNLTRSLNNLCLTTTKSMPVAVPRRPCLVVRCDEALNHDVLDPPSPTKHKKRVVFADDKGFSLTQVRTMTEPSNMPPRWSCQFLAQVTQGALAEVFPDPWEITFRQPAADYLDFRRRLDINNVSLENVIVKDTEQAVTGTVKVKNLAYHKDVFLRTTSDDWATHEDAYCTYVANSPAAHGVTVINDTFSFRIALPVRSRKLEFCVCFRCEGEEYWDNNNGINYVILKKGPPEVPKPPSSENVILGHLRNAVDNKICIAHKFTDGKHVEIDSWSEFASWNHLNNDTPYW